ncbi:hypothetical protein [Paenibacillus humicola]|uniref:hypothetical protein n=1 Tax=Paenibacillus humicola TaxID=3110540 RepID=UPI00237C3BB3|nr:hypothetical protein [Paenibacillus humicola]
MNRNENECHLAAAELNEFISRHAGRGYKVERVNRLRGGAQKAVYKIECFGGAAFILYVWDLAVNYFREETLEADPLTRSYASGRFKANAEFLQRHGIGTPAVFHVEYAGERYPFDFALAEYAGE